MQMRPRQKGMSTTILVGSMPTPDHSIASDRRRLLTSVRGEEPDLAAAAAIVTSTYWAIKVNWRRMDSPGSRSIDQRAGVKRRSCG